jgi:hypothetical protein
MMLFNASASSLLIPLGIKSLFFWVISFAGLHPMIDNTVIKIVETNRHLIGLPLTLFIFAIKNIDEVV